MPRITTCAGQCGKEIYLGSTSLPPGQATCLGCRRASPNYTGLKYKVSNRPDGYNCAVCDDYVQTSKFGPVGTLCKRHRSGGDNAHRARKFGVDYEPINPNRVFKRDRWTCGICRKRVDRNLAYPDPSCASLDHVIPMALGGGHTYQNVQCSHLACNVKKQHRGHGGEQLSLMG